jgi:hypothetical protein
MVMNNLRLGMAAEKLIYFSDVDGSAVTDGADIH